MLDKNNKERLSLFLSLSLPFTSNLTFSYQPYLHLSGLSVFSYIFPFLLICRISGRRVEKV